MNSSPKIIVLKMREIIYTIVLLFLVVLLVVCLVLMFSKKKQQNGQSEQSAITTETQQTTIAGSAADSTQWTTQSGSAADSTQSGPATGSTTQSTTDSAAEHTQATPSASGSAAENTQALQATSSYAANSTTSYTPGIYTSPITLGESTVDVEVTVDSSHINSIRLVNLSEAAAASYPLVSPSLDHIASQILEKQSLNEITCPQENRYTSQLLLSAISDALTKAENALTIY